MNPPSQDHSAPRPLNNARFDVDVDVGVDPVKDALLPPHRRSACPNQWAINMSHQDLLGQIAMAFERHITSCWLRELIQEARYRNLAKYKNEELCSFNDYDYVDHFCGLPTTREQWNERMVLREGFTLPEA